MRDKLDTKDLKPLTIMVPPGVMDTWCAMWEMYRTDSAEVIPCADRRPWHMFEDMLGAYSEVK